MKSILEYCRSEHRRAIMVARRVRLGQTKIEAKYRREHVARWLARAATVRRKIATVPFPAHPVTVAREVERVRRKRVDGPRHPARTWRCRCGRDGPKEWSTGEPCPVGCADHDGCIEIERGMIFCHDCGGSATLSLCPECRGPLEEPPSGDRIGQESLRSFDDPESL